MDTAPIKDAVFEAIAPLKAATSASEAANDFLFSAVRADASNKLPEYYFVYFLLVDLLGFKNLGQFEKIAWSVPVDFQGHAYLIEHRKFGLGIFTPGGPGAIALEWAIVVLERANKEMKEIFPDIDERLRPRG